MRLLIISALCLAVLAGTAGAHPATEQFIPIGQSPGGATMQGTLTAVAAPAAVGDAMMMSMTAADATKHDYAIGAHTRIYVDRSSMGQPSTVGTVADLKPGRTMEVRFADPAATAALWVKVRPER